MGAAVVVYIHLLSYDAVSFNEEKKDFIHKQKLNIPLSYF